MAANPRAESAKLRAAEKLQQDTEARGGHPRARAGHARAPRQAPRPTSSCRGCGPAPISRVPRLPFLLLTMAAIVAGVFGLVALNVSVNQQSFRISELQRQNRLAEARWTALQADVDRLKAPARIAKAARSARLVPAGRPRVVAWPGSASKMWPPGAATSPAAPGAGLAQGTTRSRSSATWPSPRPHGSGGSMPQARGSGKPAARPPPRRRPPLKRRRRRVNGRRRLLALLILSILAFGAISGRLIVLQVFDAGSLDQAAARQRLTVIDLPAMRGRIFDRNLNDLAISIPARSVWADPHLVKSKRHTAAKLAGVLGMSRKQVAQRLASKGRFVYLIRRIPKTGATWSSGSTCPASSWRAVARRYPSGTVAAQVLGFVDVEGHGQAGIEQHYDGLLRGQAGKIQLERDPRAGPSPRAAAPSSRPSPAPTWSSPSTSTSSTSPSRPSTGPSASTRPRPARWW